MKRKKLTYKQLALFGAKEETYTDGMHYPTHRYSAEENGMAKMLLSFFRGNDEVSNFSHLNRAYLQALCRLLIKEGYDGWRKLSLVASGIKDIEFYDLERNANGQLLRCKARFKE